jgi:secreted trypsin-like serine protease
MGHLRRLVVAAMAVVAAVVGFAFAGPAAAAHHRPDAHAAIVGGAPAQAGSWPWLAHISYALGGGSYDVCTGTVVAANLVLTAAHCAETLPGGVLNSAGRYTVVTGTLDWADAAARHVSAVTDVITHTTENYTATSSSGGVNGVNVIGDAALLELATPTTAPPITLADGADRSLLDGGTGGQIAGWGLVTAANPGSAAHGLRFAPTVIQSADYCAQYLSTFNADAQVCAIDAPRDTATTCSGDSGGPLVARARNSRWIQVGITSSGLNDCDPTLPAYFTRVDYVAAWVRRWIAALPARTRARASAAATPAA